MNLSDKQRDTIYDYVYRKEIERLSCPDNIRDVVRYGHEGIDDWDDDQLIDEAETYLEYEQEDEEHDVRVIVFNYKTDTEVHKTLKEES